MRSVAADGQGRTALVASSTAFSLALLGTTVVNIALPAIRRDLGGDVADLQWVANGYSLVLASLLLSMGALCDQRGARRVMLGGLLLFSVGATLGTVAPTLEILVVAQLTLGIGAAALIPASLTLLKHAYPEPAARGHAIGVYSAAAAVAVAAGPVVGGVLIDTIGWRAVFAIDVPAAIVIAALVLARVGETPHARQRDLDLVGQLLAVLALAALTFGLIESGSRGWGAPGALVALAVALAAGVAFVTVERRGTAPMLPLGLFGSATFTVGSITGLLFNFAVYGELFVLSLYLQDIRELSPLKAGLLFAAMPVAAGVTSLLAGRMVSRTGARLPGTLGALIAMAGALTLISLGETTPHALLVAGLILIGAGGGLAVPAITAAVVTETDARQAGVATAAFTASRQLGGLLGVAVLGGMVSGGTFVDGLRLSLIVVTVAFVVCAVAVWLVIPAHAAGSQPTGAVVVPTGTP